MAHFTFIYKGKTHTCNTIKHAQQNPPTDAITMATVIPDPKVEVPFSCASLLTGSMGCCTSFTSTN